MVRMWLTTYPGAVSRGWQPVQPRPIADLDEGRYVNGWMSSTAAAA